MGSSVLPMPYAISRVGVLTGLLTMLLVALCNDYTTCLMISAAYATGLDSFEALALWAGGPRWKVFTQAVLIALLWAPNSGGISLMGDVAQVMVGQVQDIYYSSTAAGAAAAAAGLGAISSNSSSIVTSSVVSSDATSGSSWLSAGGDWLWLRAGDGQSWMVAMTVLAVLPLSCQKHMRNLESAAAAGLVVVLGLLGALAYRAISAGMPALADGQVPLWSLQLSDRLPEAFSLLGYAFYLQPLIMPIIREMPEGATGRSALIAAVHSALLGEWCCCVGAVAGGASVHVLAAATGAGRRVGRLRVGAGRRVGSLAAPVRADMSHVHPTHAPRPPKTPQAAACSCMPASASLARRCLARTRRPT
jgi:amino acid permease